MKKIRLTAFLLPFRPTGLFISILAISTLNVLQQARSAEWKPYFGNLHSHTSYSDGSGTPDDAYRHAREVARLDFLAITEHNHKSAESGAGERQDGILIAKDPTLYNTLNQTSSEILKLMYDFRQNPKKFLTINFKLF